MFLNIQAHSFSDDLMLIVELKAEKSFILQIFYIDILAGTKRYQEKHSISKFVESSVEYKIYAMIIPSPEIGRFRIDFGSVDQNDIQLRSLVLINDLDSIKWNPDDILGDFSFNYDINIVKVNPSNLILKVNNYNGPIDPLINLNQNGFDHLSNFFGRSSYTNKNVIKICIRSKFSEKIAIMPTTKSDSINYYYRHNYFENHPPDQLLVLVHHLNTNDYYFSNFYNNRNINGIIFDLGKHIGNEFEISWIEIKNNDLQRVYKGEGILDYFEFNQFCETSLKDGVVHVKTKAMNRMFVPRFYSREILISRTEQIIRVVKATVSILLGFIFLYHFNKYYFNRKPIIL